MVRVLGAWVHVHVHSGLVNAQVLHAFQSKQARQATDPAHTHTEMKLALRFVAFLSFAATTHKPNPTKPKSKLHFKENSNYSQWKGLCLHILEA